MAAQQVPAATEKEIEYLKRRWPAHSVPAAMLMRLEQLEEELAAARAHEGSSNA